MKKVRSQIADEIIQEINRKEYFENYLKRKGRLINNASEKSKTEDTNTGKQEKYINKEVKQ